MAKFKQIFNEFYTSNQVAAPNPHYYCEKCGKDLWNKYKRLKNANAPDINITKDGRKLCNKCFYKEPLNEFTKDKRLYETPIVRFIDKLRKDKIFNKPIKIPVINTEFDNDELIIEFNGNLYTWHIEDRFSNEKEHSRDKFSTLDKCLEDLIKVLKDQIIT